MTGANQMAPGRGYISETTEEDMLYMQDVYRGHRIWNRYDVLEGHVMFSSFGIFYLSL